MDQENDREISQEMEQQPTYPQNYQKASMFCPHCGQRIDEEQTFCTSCGARVWGSTPAPVYAPPQPPTQMGRVYAPAQPDMRIVYAPPSPSVRKSLWQKILKRRG